MYKTTLTAMTLALAGVFMAAGPAGAAIADWDSQANVGNRVDFDWDNGEWNARSTESLGQDTTWGELADPDYNGPVLGGDQNRGTAAYWQPLQGEFIYTSGSGNTDVFSVSPWHNMPGDIQALSPDLDQNIRFAGLWEFELFNGPNHMDDLADIRSAYGGLPANLSTSWTLDLSNRPTSSTSASGGAQSAVVGWDFTLTQQFDRLDDWNTEPAPEVQWYEDAVYEDTWSGFHLLPESNRGYMLFASNNRALWPWTGDAEDSVDFARHWRDWDTFLGGTEYEYQHVGVTGVDGSAHLQVVPEPASMTLLGLGLAGFATRRFMSRKKA